MRRVALVVLVVVVTGTVVVANSGCFNDRRQRNRSLIVLTTSGPN